MRLGFGLASLNLRVVFGRARRGILGGKGPLRGSVQVLILDLLASSIYNRAAHALIEPLRAVFLSVWSHGLGAASGCVSTEVPPQLLNVLDFAPREAEVATDPVHRSGFPEGKTAPCRFRGRSSPGKKPIKGRNRVEAANSSSDKIAMMFTKGCRRRSAALGTPLHTTSLRRNVRFRPRGGSRRSPGRAQCKSISLPPARRLRGSARGGERALEFMG